MTDAFEASAERNSYVIDSEHTAEMARLLDQDRMITANMGWWFPDHIEPERLATVLDVACGPGGWVQEVALWQTSNSPCRLPMRPSIISTHVFSLG